MNRVWVSLGTLEFHVWLKSTLTFGKNPLPTLPTEWLSLEDERQYQNKECWVSRRSSVGKVGKCKEERDWGSGKV